MATLEAFKRSGCAVSLHASSVHVPTPTPISALTPGKSCLAMRAILRLHATAPEELWSMEGDSTLQALTRQAIGNPLPSDCDMWGDDGLNQTVAAQGVIHRRGSKGASVGGRLSTALDILRARSLRLCPARRSGVLKWLLDELPGSQ
jgi:hypothetical protein